MANHGMTSNGEGPLFDKPRFDGADHEPKRDDARLTGQLHRVWSVMKDGRPHTLDEIAKSTGDPPASISAQIRHLRKPRFGGYTIERTHLGGGLYSYQLGKGPENKGSLNMVNKG